MSRSVTYCSFAVPGRFLGAVVLSGSHDPVFASILTHRAGLNPGGQLLVETFSEDAGDLQPHEFEVMWNNRNRLLTEEETIELFEGQKLRDL